MDKYLSKRRSPESKETLAEKVLPAVNGTFSTQRSGMVCGYFNNTKTCGQTAALGHGRGYWHLP